MKEVGESDTVSVLNSGQKVERMDAITQRTTSQFKRCGNCSRSHEIGNRVARGKVHIVTLLTFLPKSYFIKFEIFA